MNKQIVRQFGTFGKNIAQDINEYMAGYEGVGRYLTVDAMYSVDQECVGGSQKVLMVVFNINTKDYAAKE